MKKWKDKELQCIQAAHDFGLELAHGLLGKLRVVLCRYKRQMETKHLPENKTVLNLWNLHGIGNRKYGDRRTSNAYFS